MQCTGPPGIVRKGGIDVTIGGMIDHSDSAEPARGSGGIDDRCKQGVTTNS